MRMFRMTYHARALGGAWAVDNFRHHFLLVLLVHRAVAFGVGGVVLAPQSLDREKFRYLPRWSTGKQKRPSGTKPEGLNKA